MSEVEGGSEGEEGVRERGGVERGREENKSERVMGWSQRRGREYRAKKKGWTGVCRLLCTAEGVCWSCRMQTIEPRASSDLSIRSSLLLMW